MSDIVIRADRVGKQYRIGASQPYYRATEMLTGLMAAPWRWAARRLPRIAPGSAADARPAPDGDRSFWALRDVSFEVERGEVIGIIGRNGAGKSTLLKILSRITEPTCGQVWLEGRVGSLLEVGTGFHPELTGRENIFLNGAILGMRRREIVQKFDEIVAFAEIERFLDTPVKRYSSGMYMRLAFAVAAHLEPEILIVDEVLAVGDFQFQEKCLGKMNQVAHSGRTVLFVSHNMAAIESLCTRAILLSMGTIAAAGETSGVVSEYKAVQHRQRTERVWDDITGAPGNELFRLRSVRLTDLQGEPLRALRSDDPGMVEVEYVVIAGGHRVGVTIVLYDERGQCILSSISNHEPVWHHKPRPEGVYKSSCLLPAQLFSDGTLSVSVILFGDNYTSAHHEHDAISFRVEDSGGVRGDYFGGWSGIVRPLLKWKTELLEAG